MKRWSAAALAVLLVVTLWACPACAAQSTAQSVSPREYQALLGRGMDVDWCKTTAGRAQYDARCAADFRKAGIQHVRIRVKDAADSALLADLDRVVADCLAAGLLPVIAYQADDLKQDPSQANIDAAAGWWRTVAEHFRTASDRLAFDLIIEVTDALNNQPDTLNAAHRAMLAAVRESNPRRIVMLSPRLRSDPAYLAELEFPEGDDYLMAEWHFYAAGPSRTNEKKLWTTGTAEERQLVLDKIAQAVRFQDATGIPTWVGAWMAGDYNDGNTYTPEEQAVFAAFVRQALTDASIPFAINADTHFYDRASGGWIGEMEPVMRAVFGPSFTDVPGTAWCWEPVRDACEAGLFSGVSGNRFLPDAPMTRAQLWTVLWRLNGSPAAGDGDGTWYGPARRWVMASGVSDGSHPAGTVTREQLAAVLYRLTARNGTPSSGGELTAFPDGAAVSAYARPALRWAVGAGLIRGSGGKLLARDGATRAQTAAILLRWQAQTAK